jgi:molybdenum cofactor cytidylyltransferase
MKFARIPVASAGSAILAHSVMTNEGRLHKGLTLTQAHIEKLQRANITHVWAAMLEPNDIHENDVAMRIAEKMTALLGNSNLRLGPASTGRCNIYATASGVCTFDASSVHHLNSLCEDITLATVAPQAKAVAGQIVATVKIIPFAVHAEIVTAALQAAAEIRLGVSAFTSKTARLILSRIDGMKESLFDKAVAITSRRLADLNIMLAEQVIVPHQVDAIAEQLLASDHDIILVLGGSAISDRADIIPAAIEKSGGTIVRMGMPVDPGNLLCFAQDKTGRPILGLPGCARSPKFNGLDIILQRLAANLPVTSTGIAQLGVGGLLDEQPERGHLREARSEEKHVRPLKIGALVLAAGQSSRMGIDNKLLLDDGRGPVITKVIDSLKRGNIQDIIVVTGKQADKISALVAPVPTVHNPAYKDGLSSSIRVGLCHVPDDWDGALIVLADMPAILPETISSICAAAASGIHDAVVPVHSDKQGHPVLWKRSAFALLQQVQGDMGGKAQLASMAERVLNLSVEDPGILMDIDTPQAWQAYQKLIRS